MTSINAPIATALSAIPDRKARGRRRAAEAISAVSGLVAWEHDGWSYTFDVPPFVKLAEKDIERAAAAFDLTVRDGAGIVIFHDRVQAWDGTPVLVPDGTWREEAIGGKRVLRDNLREDPVEAALVDLAHTVRVVTRGGERLWVKAEPGTVNTFYSGNDGYLRSAWDSYLTARLGNVSEIDTAGTSLRVGQQFQDPNYNVWESFIEWDTSILDNAPTVASMSLYGLSGGDLSTNFTAEARAFDYGASLTSLDWRPGADISGYTLVSSFATSGFTTAGYNDFASEEAFLASVNVSGPTRIFVSSNRTRLGTAPTGGEYCYFYSSDQGGTAQDPKLVLTHTLDNTAPSFSAQPAASYNSGFTRTGPSNTPISVLFTATDAEQTGAGALSYEVRTSATPGGGTLVGSGTCTSGAQKSHSLAYNASGLAHGSNTLYVHLSDGVASVVVSSSFVVLRDDAAPTDSTSISVTPDPLPTKDTTYEVGFQPNDAASTGAGEMRASLYRNTGSSGFLKGLIGLTSGGAALFESVGNDTELVPGVNTRYIVARDGAGNTKETPFTVTVEGGDIRRRLRAGTPGSGMHRAPGSPTVW